MAKVITGAGLNEFIESGKHETIAPHKTEAPKPEAKVEEKPRAEAKIEEKEPPVEADGDLMPEETLEQARAKIAKKHRELKAEKAAHQRTREERLENERLAESQFNERRLVESERDRLNREIQELKGRAAPVEEPQVKPPSKEDPKFLNEKGEFQWDKFTDAQAEYRIDKYKAEEASKAQAIEQAALDAKVMERVEVAKAKYPDFMEKLHSQEERKDVPPYIVQFLRESEQGADIAYYFTDNREELTKISKLSPIMALERLGKLAARFEPKDDKVETTPKVEKADKVETPRTSTAPPPITPLSGASSGTVITDPSKMSFQQLRAYEREKGKRKG